MNKTSNETLVDKFEAGTHLPEAKATKPATIIASNLFGLDETTIVRTRKHPQEGFSIFLQVASREGGVVQLVLGRQVCDAIYRQRDRLMDRSTPASRQRARASRERARGRAAKAAKKAAKAAS